MVDKTRSAKQVGHLTEVIMNMQNVQKLNLSFSIFSAWRSALSSAFSILVYVHIIFVLGILKHQSLQLDVSCNYFWGICGLVTGCEEFWPVAPHKSAPSLQHLRVLHEPADWLLASVCAVQRSSLVRVRVLSGVFCELIIGMQCWICDKGALDRSRLAANRKSNGLYPHFSFFCYRWFLI